MFEDTLRRIKKIRGSEGRVIRITFVIINIMLVNIQIT